MRRLGRGALRNLQIRFRWARERGRWLARYCGSFQEQSGLRYYRWRLGLQMPKG